MHLEYGGKSWNLEQAPGPSFLSLGPTFSSIMLNPHLSARRAAALMMEATPELLPQIPNSLGAKEETVGTTC